MNFYTKNKSILSTEIDFQRSLIHEYTKLQEKFDEYFLAINDYKAYTIKYDKRFETFAPV